MKIYLPEQTSSKVNGGLTFNRNLKKGLAGRAEFVDSWQACDIFLVSGITLVNFEELEAAKAAGKGIVLRVDNVPRKSRNRGLRPNPHERLKIIADSYADLVIYQSKWAERYCHPLSGDGMVIYNGVDSELFKPDPSMQKKNRYLYAYHGRNELKQFWLAHYIFQMRHRDHEAVGDAAQFWFINDFGSEQPLMDNGNYDFWNGENYQHLELETTPEGMVRLMQQCHYLIFPSTLDACPNTVLEARACGMEVIGTAPEFLAGTNELLNPDLDISLERMCDEYMGAFDLVDRS